MEVRKLKTKLTGISIKNNIDVKSISKVSIQQLTNKAVKTRMAA